MAHTNRSFAGTRALVTGAASGIGRACADALTEEGAEVIRVDRVSCQSENEIVIDLQEDQAAEDLRRRAGQVHYLVNAAGVSRPRDIWDVSTEEWREVMGINAEAPFRLMQKFAPEMGRGGAIVNISSTNAKVADNVHEAAYNASKAAVVALTRTFARALATQGVRVNCVCPGVTDTPMLRGIFEIEGAMVGEDGETQLKKYLPRVPLGRLAEPEEIAAAVTFLLSKSASYVTGQALNVCGGMVTW